MSRLYTKIVSFLLMVPPHVLAVSDLADGACLCTAPPTKPSPDSGRIRINLDICSYNVPKLAGLRGRTARSTMFVSRVPTSGSAHTTQELRPKQETIETSAPPLLIFSVF